MPELRDAPGYPSVELQLQGDVRLYIVKRTQIYLDGRQMAELDERASAEGTTRSTLIRRAIDAYLAQQEEKATTWRREWQEAVAEAAGSAPYLEDGAAYVEKLRRVGADRLTELEKR